MIYHLTVDKCRLWTLGTDDRYYYDYETADNNFVEGTQIRRTTGLYPDNVSIECQICFTLSRGRPLIEMSHSQFRFYTRLVAIELNRHQY